MIDNLSTNAMLRAVTQAVIKTAETLKATHRDKREPDRRGKEALQLRLSAIIERRFRRQAKRISAYCQNLPHAKAITEPPDIQMLFEYDDDDKRDLAYLVKVITEAARGGVTLFGQSIGVAHDWTMTNGRAAQWARRYVGELIRGIDDTTKQVVRDIIKDFVNTPGMTLGDVVSRLPFDEQRAQSVAVTEITRAYSQGQRQGAEELHSQFPGVKVVITWMTNVDDIVCPLCGELDGKEVEQGETFYPPDGYNDGHPPRHVNCRCWEGYRTRIDG